MKKLIIIIHLILLTNATAFSQEIKSAEKDKFNSIYLESSFMSWYGYLGLHSITANYEGKIRKGNSGYTLIYLGAGPIIGIMDYSGTYTTLHFGLNQLFGKKNQFFESGIGINFMNNNALINAKIGYRCFIGKKFVSQTSFKYYFPGHNMGFSIGLGYRFN